MMVVETLKRYRNGGGNVVLDWEVHEVPIIVSGQEELMLYSEMIYMS